MVENCIPILEVSDENFEQLWPALTNAIKEASFIALDCELSGLGNRSKLNCSEIDLRYQNIKEIVQEYAIVSLGISCFSCQSSSSLDLDNNGSNQSVKTHNYVVQTFNVLTICSTKYVVEYSSVKFLLSHGFDFNRQYAHGLPYTRGEDRESRKRKEPNVRDLFQLIIRYEKPIVLHNGLVDLLFLYQAFYADLPRNIETFAADLLEMFPTGIYDTKYISEFHQSFSATFLEYLFKKLQLENDDRKKSGAWHCRIKFPPYPRKGVKGLSWHNYLQVFDQNQCQSDLGTPPPLCDSYKFHGWCPKATVCLRSHNVDRIVRELPPPKARKRKFNAGIAYSSVAQLINLKKRNMEKEKESMKRKTEFPSHTRSNPIKATMESSHQTDFFHSRNNSSSRGSYKSEDDKDSCSDFHNKVESKENGDNSTPCFENGHMERTDDSSPSINKSTNVNSVSFNSNKISSSTAFENGETSRQRDCNGHSAGFDAFMTGFIFACDVAMLGKLPTVSAFQSPKEMCLEDVAGKVYLIGKEFPFLIRNSAYGGTSPTHDRIIKTIRMPQT